MGLRGPPKKPAAIEAAQGFPGRRKAQAKAVLQQQRSASDSPSVHGESLPTSSPPPPAPAWLKKAARAIWGHVWADARAHMRLKATDEAFLARYCALRAEVEAVMAKMPRPTVLVTTSAGDRVHRPDPRFTRMLELQGIVQGMEKEIGFTPVSRVNLHLKLANMVDRPPAPASAGAGQPADPPPDGGPLGILKRNTAH